MIKYKKGISRAQKAAQRRYDKKTKQVSVKYTLSDMKEYERLREYLDCTGQSINSFVKNLIKKSIDELSSNESKFVQKSECDLICDKVQDYCPCAYIGEESIQYLIDTFGTRVANRIMEEYFVTSEAMVEDVVESSGDEFEEWIEEVKQKVTEGNYDNKTIDDVIDELMESMLNYIT